MFGVRCWHLILLGLVCDLSGSEALELDDPPEFKIPDDSDAIADLSDSSSLTCYQCESLSTSSQDETLSSLIEGTSNPDCENIGSFTPAYNVPVVVCPNEYDYKCGVIRGNIKGKILWADVTVKVTARDCIATTESNGCYKPDEETKSIVNGVVQLLTGATVDGLVCYCSEDYCDANCWVRIGDVCFPDWAVYTMCAAGSVLSIILLSGCLCCCCCCCCRPCRKTTHPHVHVPVPQTSSVTYVTTGPQGPEGGAGGPMGSCTNPMYDYNQQVQPAIGKGYVI